MTRRTAYLLGGLALALALALVLYATSPTVAAAVEEVIQPMRQSLRELIGNGQIQEAYAVAIDEHKPADAPFGAFMALAEAETSFKGDVDNPRRTSRGYARGWWQIMDDFLAAYHVTAESVHDLDAATAGVMSSNQRGGDHDVIKARAPELMEAVQAGDRAALIAYTLLICIAHNGGRGALLTALASSPRPLAVGTIRGGAVNVAYYARYAAHAPNFEANRADLLAAAEV